MLALLDDTALDGGPRKGAATERMCVVSREVKPVEDLLRFVVGPKQEISVHSKMDDAAIYLDGPHRVVSVRLGDTVSFGVSDEPLNVLGLRGRRSR